ncbi:hypothetical protein K503DRAFT_796273 [Rhizopogon vinicolor AM-OR11-026]|uniref:Uncharacterized protein n=1 Tax=Rhizopogon vinicolor AM-OR11-026 TaxID=1314800 RepID=A0A1B7NEZ1_9AGAM|nr:hypothetical protein K503DRAFT_796273 [Rhizopogon vinicolor AM-OR11-026]
MTDPFVPPPSYELSQQGWHDQKIPEKLQELILSKIPIQGVEEERDEDDSKDSKEPEKQPSLFQTPVQPLRVQKRTPRGARPLPPSPADAQSRSKPAASAPPLKEKEALQNHEAVFSPPPPFTVVGPTPNNRASFNPSPVHSRQQRPSSSLSSSSSYSSVQPHADSYRRISHSPYLEHSSLSPPENSTPATRMRFDPSIAYGTSSNTLYDLWERPSHSTSNNAPSLYSSAVSSYLHPASAVNPGSRSSYLGMNRYPTSPRPSSLSSDTLTSASGPVAPALQYHSPYQTLSPSARPRPSQGERVRWATSEAEFTRDIYP